MIEKYIKKTLTVIIILHYLFIMSLSAIWNKNHAFIWVFTGLACKPYVTRCIGCLCWRTLTQLMSLLFKLLLTTTSLQTGSSWKIRRWWSSGNPGSPSESPSLFHKCWPPHCYLEINTDLKNWCHFSGRCGSKRSHRRERASRSSGKIQSDQKQQLRHNLAAVIYTDVCTYGLLS